MARRPPWEDQGLDPRFRELARQTYAEKIVLLEEFCKRPMSQQGPLERMRLEGLLVEKYGNKSEKFGMKFAMVPSWAGIDGRCRDHGVEMDY